MIMLNLSDSASEDGIFLNVHECIKQYPPETLMTSDYF